jgi:hypothetical protein
MAQKGSGRVTPGELANFGDAIARPAIRKAFAENPIRALELAGVDVGQLPPDVVDLFAELSPWELDVIGRVAARAKAIPDIDELRDHVGVIIH